MCIRDRLQQHDYFDAYLRHDSLVADSEGTYHLEEGYRCADGIDVYKRQRPDGAKWFCSLMMLIGRLEIFSVLVILTPAFWREN